MKPWNQRPFEVRNLFNPAFCGMVLFRALDGYEEVNPEGMPFSLALIVLPLCLQKDSREVFAGNTKSYFMKIVEKNPHLIVNLADRVNDLLPHTLEALGVLFEKGCFTVQENGRIVTIPDRVRKTVKGTDESVSCQRVARFLGKEFARIADRVTIYTTLGIRP